MAEQKLTLKTLSVEELEFQPDNPRLSMYDDELEDLGNSIKRDGLIEPIVVRPKGAKYEVVAGERRVRAAIQFNIPRLNAIVREGMTGEEASRLRLIENIKRKDLSDVEKAIGIKAHIRKFRVSLEEVAKEIGVSPATVKSWIREEENLSPKLKSELTFLRQLSGDHLHILGKYNYATQEKLAEVILRHKLSNEQTRFLRDMFDANPETDLEALAEAAKRRMKMVKVALPIEEAKKVEKRAKELLKKEEKAKKKLEKHLRKNQPKITKGLMEMEIPYETPDVKALREMEFGKVVATENLTEMEVKHLQELMSKDTETPIRELAQRVKEQIRPQIIVLEIAPKLYSAVEDYANSQGISVKEGALMLIQESLIRHGLWREEIAR